MKIFVTRHGSISWKKIGFLSFTDLDLTEEGVSQSHKIGERLKHKGIQEIYSSQLKRAIQTANAIEEYLSLKVNITPALNEVNFGIFERLTLEEAEQNYPEIYHKRKEDKWNVTIPEGESYKDAEQRILPFISELVKRNKDVLLVTHVTVIKVLLKSLTNLSLDEIEKIHFRTTGLTVLEHKKKLIFDPIIINDFSHLEK